MDLAVYRGSEIIQSASDFFNYCENHLKDTKSTYCKRRIFRYVEKIDRNNISFKAVPGIRRLHQVVSTKSNNDTLAVRNMSCYTCENCINGNYNNCTTSIEITEHQTQKIKSMVAYY